MPSLNVKPIVPAESILPSIKSASKHVLRRRLVEVQPQANVSYTYAGNQVITFDINSPTDFWDIANSYLRFDLTCDLTNGGSDETNRYLSEGGGHCLFRTLTIETQSGVLLQRIDRYNKLYALMSAATHSKDYVDNVLVRAGDSTCIEYERGLQGDGFIGTEDVTYTQANANYDHTGGAAEQLLILGTSAGESWAVSEVRVGDILRVETAVLNYTCRVLTIVDEQNVTVEGLPAADIAANAILSIKRIKDASGSGIDAMRKLAANTDDIVLTMQPFAPLLGMRTWMPLFLIRGGLRISLTMDRPEYCLSVPAEPSGVGFAGASVQIDNPVWVCQFVQPDQSLSNTYVDLFKTSGLAYNYIGYRHFMDIMTAATGDHTLQMNSNVRSARHVLSRIQNLRAETVTSATANSGKSTYTCDSIAQGLKANLNEYQFESGSERFPQSKPVDCTDISNNEAFIEFERVFNSLGAANIISKRFHPVQWQERAHDVNKYEATQATESQRFVVSAQLARDPSPWAGLDLSLAPLQGIFNFDAAYNITDHDGTSNSAAGSRYIHAFLGYDQALLISENGIQVYS